MPTFRMRTPIAATARELHDWHMRPGAFERLTPAWAGMRMVDPPAAIADGARARLELRAGALRLAWRSRYEVEPGREFTDVQERGPMHRWVHVHRFLDDPPDGSVLEDEIDYELPLGSIGNLAAGSRVERRLRRLFAFRHERTKGDVEVHASARDEPRLRVALSGSTGLVGSALAAFLTTGGHAIRPLVRRAPRAGTDEVRFDPPTGEIDARGLDGCDAVVHLAGESVAAGRWTAARKARIQDSRVAGTRILSDALAGLDRPPRVLVCASAIGFYGDRGDEWLDETSAVGTGFLAETCAAWEAASASAERAGVRVVRLRIGVVLASAGGALARMRAPFALGLGGAMGSGRQWMSWIALDDVVGAIHSALFRPALRGPVNAVAPEPSRNGDFARTMGRVLRRPAVLPVPALAVRAALGEMGRELLLSSARVEPRRLLDAGFRFRHPALDGALRFEMGTFS